MLKLILSSLLVLSLSPATLANDDYNIDYEETEMSEESEADETSYEDEETESYEKKAEVTQPDAKEMAKKNLNKKKRTN